MVKPAFNVKMKTKDFKWQIFIAMEWELVVMGNAKEYLEHKKISFIVSYNQKTAHAQNLLTKILQLQTIFAMALENVQQVYVLVRLGV